MKINGYLPGGIRPDPIKPAPKKEKTGEAQSNAASSYRGHTRDEYIKGNRSILPQIWRPVYDKSGARDATEQDAGAGSLDGAIKRLTLQIGDTPDRVEQADRASASFTSHFVSITDTFRSGFQSDYTVTDAAVTLWRQEYTVIRASDFSSGLEKLRDRLRADNYSMNPTAEELSAYTEQLRQNGLDGSVNWSALGQDFGSFGDVRPDELADSLDYLASRFVAVMDQLGRSYSGEELAAEQTRLEFVWQKGAGSLIENYTERLQGTLGLSNEDAQGIRDSFGALFTARAEAYFGVLEQTRQSIAADNPEDAWLQNHDAYIAARLREAASVSDGAAGYSAKDLAYAGEIAQGYGKELVGAASGARDEADLALNIAMMDMKVETMIREGHLGENMSVLLRSSRVQIQSILLDAADQRMAYRESTRLSGEAAGSFAAMDRDLFSGIYDAVMSAFQSGHDVSGAIHSGVSYGQAATARAGAAHPEVQRWGQPMENYWKNFYTTPEKRERTDLDRQIDELLAEIGQSRSAVNSTYQNYMNSWNNFVTTLNRADEGLPLWF